MTLASSRLLELPLKRLVSEPKREIGTHPGAEVETEVLEAAGGRPDEEEEEEDRKLRSTKVEVVVWERSR